MKGLGGHGVCGWLGESPGEVEPYERTVPVLGADLEVPAYVVGTLVHADDAESRVGRGLGLRGIEPDAVVLNLGPEGIM